MFWKSYDTIIPLDSLIFGTLYYTYLTDEAPVIVKLKHQGTADTRLRPTALWRVPIRSPG